MVPSHLTKVLAVDADVVINRVLNNGAPGQHPPSGEVGFVAAIVLGAVPSIASAWRTTLQPCGLSVRMTGVFCHQTPQATFTDASGTQRQCELSDLLVVAEDLTTGSAGRRWAALVQAKMANIGGGTTLSTGGDLVQLDLMTRWPPFTLPSAYAPGPRDFSNCVFAGTTIECGRYGLIEPRPNLDWRQQAPAKSMAAGGDTLGTFLAKMIESGQSGYGREATGTGDDWSRTVDELIRVTGAQAFTHAAGFSGQRTRGHTAIAFVGSVFGSPIEPLAGYSFHYGGDGSLPADGQHEPDGQGISLLRIGITKTTPEAKAREDPSYSNGKM